MSRHIRNSSKNNNFIIWTSSEWGSNDSIFIFHIWKHDEGKHRTHQWNNNSGIVHGHSDCWTECSWKMFAVGISLNAMRRVYLLLLDFRKMISLSKWLFALRLLASVAVCFPEKLRHTAKSSLFVCIIFIAIHSHLNVRARQTLERVTVARRYNIFAFLRPQHRRCKIQ